MKSIHNQLQCLMDSSKELLLLAKANSWDKLLVAQAKQDKKLRLMFSEAFFHDDETNDKINEILSINKKIEYIVFSERNDTLNNLALLSKGRLAVSAYEKHAEKR